MSAWLSEHFLSDEFTCADGTTVPKRYMGNLQSLVEELEYIRSLWDRPITILSGYRTRKYNTAVGGAKKSQHLLAKAADIVVAGVSAKEVAAKLREEADARRIINGGIGEYKNFTHYDCGKARRWRG